MGTYTEPVGDPQRAKEFLADADPVGEWLEALPDECDGMLMKDLAEKANKELDPDKEFKAQGIGNRVAVSVKWRRHISPSGTRSIKLKKQPSEVEDTVYCAGPCEKMYSLNEIDAELGTCVSCGIYQTKEAWKEKQMGALGNGIYPVAESNIGPAHMHGCSGAKGWFHRAEAGIEPADCQPCKSHLHEHEDEDEVPPPGQVVLDGMPSSKH